MPDIFVCQTTNSNTAALDQVWSRWTTGTNITFDPWLTWAAANSTNTMWPVAYEARPEDPAARAEREARVTAEAVAAARARDLLNEHLDAEQREALARRRAFRVVGSDGQEYEIVAHGHSGNVRRLVEGRPVEELCIHATTPMPDEDHWLEQLLLLQADAEAFRRIANVTRVA